MRAVGPPRQRRAAMLTFAGVKNVETIKTIEKENEP